MNSKSLCIAVGAAALSQAALAEGWTDKAIAPVANPIYFETPLIQNEVRPLFAYHRLDSGLLGVGGDVKVYAAQLRYAINDRLALIATKDGYTRSSSTTARSWTVGTTSPRASSTRSSRTRPTSSW